MSPTIQRLIVVKYSKDMQGWGFKAFDSVTIIFHTFFNLIRKTVYAYPVVLSQSGHLSASVICYVKLTLEIDCFCIGSWLNATFQK